jgi:hypothetical protein
MQERNPRGLWYRIEFRASANVYGVTGHKSTGACGHDARNGTAITNDASIWIAHEHTSGHDCHCHNSIT